MTDGSVALERGDWQGAREAFELSLQQGDDPEALEGFGLAAWWLDLADVVFDARERAYRGYLERGDRAAAARMAVWLAWDTAAFRGEQAVASGWLQRARRLLEGHPDAPENAWLALRAGVFALLDDGDPEEAEKLAGEAVRIGQRLRAVDYEMVGRALHGFARVAGSRPGARSGGCGHCLPYAGRNMRRSACGEARGRKRSASSPRRRMSWRHRDRR